MDEEGGMIEGGYLRGLSAENAETRNTTQEHNLNTHTHSCLTFESLKASAKWKGLSRQHSQTLQQKTQNSSTAGKHTHHFKEEAALHHPQVTMETLMGQTRTSRWVKLWLETLLLNYNFSKSESSWDKPRKLQTRKMIEIWSYSRKSYLWLTINIYKYKQKKGILFIICQL